LYPNRMSFYVGDHLMPAIVGSVLILLGLIMALRRSKVFKVRFPDKAIMRNMILVMAVLVAYWIMINYLGYTIATLIASVVLFRVIGSYTYKKALLYSAIQTAGIYVIFVYGLSMPLPVGLFNF